MVKAECRFRRDAPTPTTHLPCRCPTHLERACVTDKACIVLILSIVECVIGVEWELSFVDCLFFLLWSHWEWRRLFHVALEKGTTRKTFHTRTTEQTIQVRNKKGTKRERKYRHLPLAGTVEHSCIALCRCVVFSQKRYTKAATVRVNV